MIQEWFKELLIDGIISNLSGTFDTVNTKVGEIAGEVGMTPAGWNGGIFNMIRGLSETVIVPIAGIILTFVMCYELIQLIVEKNNLHDFDTWLFWKWIFKTFCAVLIVTNTWNIVMAVFDMAQSVVNQSAGVIISDAGIDISGQPAAEQPDHSAAGHLLRRAVFHPQGLSRAQGLQAGRRGQCRTYRFRPVLRRYGRVGPDPDGRLNVPPCPAFVPGISR